MKELFFLPLSLPCWLLLMFLLVFWEAQEFPSYFTCLCYALSFLDVKEFQNHTVDPVEGQDWEHLEKAPNVFIISNFIFLILFWSSTKICPGNLFFPFSLLAFSFHVNFGACLRRCLDFVIGSDVALGLSVFVAIVHIPWHLGDRCYWRGFISFSCGWVSLIGRCCFSWVLQCWFREQDERKCLPAKEVNNFLLDSIFRTVQKQPSLSVQRRGVMGRRNFFWWQFTLRLMQQYHKPLSQRAAFIFCYILLGGCVLTVPNKKNSVAVWKSCLSDCVLSDSHHPAYC